MRRLLDKRGSVLFLVVVVMSILIIAASATYYIVNNQHSSVNVRYSSEQSYQTALSVSETVSDYIDGYLEAIAKSGNDLTSYNGTLVGKMLNLSSGASQEITSELNLSAEGMGNAKVTITKPASFGGQSNPRTSGENKIHTFEITTEAVVNGETVKVTQVKEIISGPTDYFTRFLTSTGGRGEDVTFGSFLVLSEAYFENEYTVLGASSATRMADSVYSSGSLYIRGLHYSQPGAGHTLETVVAENLYLQAENIQFMSMGGDVYIGGNFETMDNNNTSAGTPIYADNIYVMGDFRGHGGMLKAGASMYVAGNCYLDTITGINSTFDNRGKIYVNGDLYINAKGAITVPNTAEFYVKGKVYLSGVAGTWSFINGIMQCSDIVENGGNWSRGAGVSIISSMTKPFDDTTMKNVTAHIASSTKKNEYQEWDAETYFGKLEQAAITAGAPLADIYPGTQPGGTPGDPPVFVDTDCVINDNCILHPSEAWAGSWTMHNIIIDASSKDIYIKLQPEAGSDTFSFAKKNPSYATPYHSNLNILIKGSHSVIFVLPHNVNFVMPAGTFLGHVGFAAKITGLSVSNVINSKPNLYVDYFYAHHRGDINANGTPTSGAIQAVNSWFKKASGVSKVPDGSLIIDSGQFASVDSDTHNNIFIVTKGTANELDFSGTATFCGYIYAPKSILRANTTKGPSLSFIGGMIVGSYTYSDLNAALMFTMPCDYANNYSLSKKTDIVKHLINFANNNGSSTPSADSIVLQGYRTSGYK